MKFNIVAGKTRFGIDVKDTALISEVKQLIANILAVNGSRMQGTEGNEKKSFCLIHNGINLNNDCTVGEIGLTSGSTLRYKTNKITACTLRVFVRCLSTFVEFREEVSIGKTTIWDVRRQLQNHLGIPVSVFTLHKKDDHRVLFDIRPLSQYGISVGDTLVLEVWKGMNELIVAAIDGDISRTLSAIPSYQENPCLNRYYLRVALFIAAHKDSVNLAAHIIQRGARCEEAVGEHPFREWCLQQSHTDIHKAPIHQAGMNGSFRTLSMFIRHRPACIVAKDGDGNLPSTHAWKNRHIQCWKLIMVTQEQIQVVCYFANLSLTTYSMIMKWCRKAKDRVLYFKTENKKKLLVQVNLCPVASSCLGDPIVINGYEDVEEKRVDAEGIARLSVWSYNMNAVKPGDGDKLNIIDSQSHLKQNKISRRYNRRGQAKNKLSTPQHLGRFEAKKIIFEKTGKTSSQIASRCFEMGQSFENMKWRAQLNVALRCSKNFIENKNEQFNLPRKFDIKN